MKTIPHRPARGLFAPDYYPAFACIADRCRHSCCIDWEICIDDETLAKYQCADDIMATVTDCGDGPCFSLTEAGRCPHLDERGLCRIILSHGEEYLSEICRKHPRFYNEVGIGRTEVGLGLVCEEACRLILTHEKPVSLIKIAEMNDADDAGRAPSDYDPLPERDRILSMIDAREGMYHETAMALRETFAIPAIHICGDRIDRFLSLEILDAEWEQTLRTAQEATDRTDKPDSAVTLYDPYFSRLLVYFVYRHVSIAANRDDLRARLMFALLSTDMIRYLHKRERDPSPGALMDLARRYSAEIEYSEDNTDELIFACACAL